MLVYGTVCLITTLTVWMATNFTNGKNIFKRNMIRLNQYEQTTGVIKYFLIIFSLIIFITVCSIRYDVGQDYLYTYVPYFQQVANNSASRDMEIGFWFLNYLVSRFTDQYIYIFSICAIIFFVFTYLEIFRSSPYPAFSVFLIVGTSYFFIFLNTMRQMTAVAILFFATRYIENRQFWKFILCVFAASLFHYSCLIYIVAYFLMPLKIKPRTAFVTIAMVLIFSPVFSKAVGWIISLTPYSKYIDSQFDTGEKGLIVRLISFSVLMLGTLLYNKDAEHENNRYQIFFNFQLFAVCISFITGSIPLAGRLRWMFGYPVICFIPLICERFKNTLTRTIVKTIIVILYILYIIITIGVRNGNNVLPFKTIFTEVM